MANAKYFSAPEYIYEGTVRYFSSFSAVGTGGNVYFSGDSTNSYIWIAEAQFSALSADKPVLSQSGKLVNGNVSDQYITYSSRASSEAFIAPSAGGTPSWRKIEINDINNLTSSLNAKEPTISAGTASQVYKGNKTWGSVDYTELTNAPTAFVYSAVSGVPTNTLLGRSTAGTGTAEYLSPSSARTLLGLTGWATKSYTDGSTTDIAEGTNLYYTDIRVNARIASARGAADGIAPLGSDSKIPSSYLPALAITDTFVVASSAAQIALSTAEQGDIAVRTDISKSYILKVTGGHSAMANWQELLTPTDTVLSVNGFTGAVSLTTTNISEGTNLYYTDARVRAATLSGYSVGSNTGFSASDTILQAFGKAQAQIDNKEPIISSAASASYVYKGNKTWGPISYSEIAGVPSGNSVKYSAAFVGQSTWIINHNFSSSATSTVCYVNGYEIDASIQIGSNANSAYFATAKTGYAVVFG